MMLFHNNVVLVGLGSERGQIRKITDHNHIIPFYAYGVGTYDFDMKEITPLAKMAQDEAEAKVYKFFKEEITGNEI